MKKRLFYVLLMSCFMFVSCAAKSDKKMAMNESTSITNETKSVAYKESYADVAKEELSDTDSTTAGGTNGSVSTSTSSEYEQKYIRNVNMQVETLYFDDLLGKLDSMIKGYGGYVESSQLENGSKNNRFYNLVMRIPQAKLDEFLENVDDTGMMVIRSKNETMENITLSYYDSVEHKKSLEVERERILELIKQADSLEYVVQLEDKLSELRYQISSYESQIRLYDDQVNYSTIDMSIYEKEQIVVVEDETIFERISRGLGNNLTNIKEGGTNFFVGLVCVLPYLIIYGVIFAILGFILYRVYRKAYPKEKKVKKENQRSDTIDEEKKRDE